MFKELTREMRRMKRGVRITVALEDDPDGYIDQMCPSLECKFRFKIYGDDRKKKEDDEAMFCPQCGHTDRAEEWFTPEQQRYLEKAAFAHVDRRITRAMKIDARRFNRQQPRNGFVRMTMSIKGQPKSFALPPTATEPMQTKIECSKCSCHYAVIGAAFFCPACGHNDARQMFYLSLDSRLRALDQTPKLRADISDRDTAEDTVRMLVEHTLQHAVTAFQKYAETLYQGFAKTKEMRQNVFQHLADGSDLWHSATGKQYSDYISDAELATLTLAFQQRHLFSHNNGIVDQRYLERSGDTSYQLGQRIVLQEKRVREYIYLVRKLASCMEETARENKAGL